MKYPAWYDKTKQRQVEYAPRYFGWIQDLGDGTCRYINDPLLGESNYLLPNYKEVNRNRPHYGDRVKLVNGKPDPTQIIERWQPELYDEDGDLKGVPKPNRREKEGIIGFGESVFYPYHAKIYGLEEVRWKLEARENLSSNDWGVLGCYCEDDLEATLLIHEIEQTREAKEHLNREGLLNFNMDVMLIMTYIDQMTDLDRHFKVHRFTPMLIAIWKTTLAHHWAEFIAAARNKANRLPFHAPHFVRLLSTEEPAKAEAAFIAGKRALHAAPRQA